jgi:uncharacterized membrane protein
MSKLGWAASVAAGAALMYELDPAAGPRRRARLRDAALHAAKVTVRSYAKARDDGTQRLRGAVARLRPARSADDDLLASRVRAAIGRVVSHPHAIVVTASNGVIELGGPIFAQEADALVELASDVSGVLGVVDRLERHQTEVGVPALQGGIVKDARRGLARESWPPSIRWLVGAGGAAFALAGLRRFGPLGAVSTALGVAAVARAVFDEPLGHVLGLVEEPGIRVSKTVRVEAPIHEVFPFFVAFGNFPKFMRHVQQVSDLGDGRWRWKVEGPAGVPFQWDAQVTRLVENEVVEWSSVPGSPIKHRGRARFESMPDGTTRLSIDLSYEPPLGEIGHALAKLLGADPKRELDDDMLRFKSILEHGKATGREGTVTREDIRA